MWCTDDKFPMKLWCRILRQALSEQHFTEGDEMEDNLDDDNIDYIIIEEIERSRKAV